jgi:hypothetical protein
MSIIVVSFDPESITAAARRKGKYGRSNSLKWPWLFDILKSRGLDPSAAAAISNSRLKFRKKGRLNVLTAKQAHSPAVRQRIAEAEKKGKKVTGKTLTRGIKFTED